VLSVFGTRPEAVKMAPVVRELAARPGVRSVVCVTAQHREMLDQVLDTFAIRPDYDLGLMRERQDLAQLAAGALTALSPVLDEVRPDAVLVQGDTTTALAAALAAFYRRVPVGHVEAGLRTGDRYSPFPEEINRRVVGVVATWHFAPTERAARALRAEGVDPGDIFVTGNTVVDALLAVVRERPEAAPAIPGLNGRERLVLVTAHRRENFGAPLEGICAALRTLVERHEDLRIVYPVHLNPAVQEPVRRLLADHPRIALLPPLDYAPFAHLIRRADLILTDSGGIQEEAPAFGTPVLVLRRDTERPEAIEAGTARLVGTDPAAIVAEAGRLLDDPAAYAAMARAGNPFGDGTAARRIVDILLERLGVGDTGEMGDDA
jgi:UDP-N-acetylglucosamine 2-epimerase